MEKLSNNALKILQERYLLKDTEGSLQESPEEMFRRVAHAIAIAELVWGGEKEVQLWGQHFFDLMSSLTFLPNSPTLMNAGTGKGQLSACFVLPVEDSLEGIFETLKQAALVHQNGGGTGFNFSQLRPSGDRLNHYGGFASGPVSFIKLYDFATEQVKQGGRRRGANMGVLNVNHPDILEFIKLRVNGKPLQNFNLSVGVTDDFMEAVRLDKDWELIHPNSGKCVRTIKAGLIWQEILKNAWESGNPGLIFLDTINYANSLIQLGRINSTNPCGEVPLMDYESCNLGSINLLKFLKGKEIDWPKLADTVHKAVRLLDNVIEVNQYPNEKIAKASLGNRKIGLGVMGWADMLIRIGIPYETEEAVRLGKKLMGFIQEKSKQASIDLARERGSFGNWHQSVFFPHEPIRNATRTSIAPTGTISIIADVSSSIEPLFALAFRRRQVLDGQALTTVHDFFMETLEHLGLDTKTIVDQVMEQGTCSNIKEIPKHIKPVFKTALEIAPVWHLKHQIAFQEFTDNAVSKTVNLPSAATQEDISEIYKLAWEWKAKGITVFRNDTGKEQVLYKGIREICHA